MKIIYIIFILLTFKLSIAQEIGKVTAGKDMDEKKMLLIDKGFLFNTHRIWIMFETFTGTFGRMKLIFRIIKHEDGNEKIYSSEDYEVDPEWEVTFQQLYLPEGVFQIKFYDTEGNLLGKSYPIMIVNKFL